MPFYVFAFSSFLYFWYAGTNLHLAVFWIYFFLTYPKKKKKLFTESIVDKDKN